MDPETFAREYANLPEIPPHLDGLRQEEHAMMTHQHITHEGYDEPPTTPDRCPRCGRTLLALNQRTVILRDALSPPIFVHEDCSYDIEWANGAASYYQETDQ